MNFGNRLRNVYFWIYFFFIVKLVKFCEWLVEGGSWIGVVRGMEWGGGILICSVLGDRDGVIVCIIMVFERGCRGMLFICDDLVGLVEWFILVYFMIIKMRENRIIVIIIGMMMVVIFILEFGLNNKWNREKSSCFKVWWFEGNYCLCKIWKKSYFWWNWLLCESGYCCNYC